ncbi:hypothetical protein [Psychromonas sp. Urea-02u-13]|uniref:hypothetical protein n=1 Tax=Psychromonas sp. Urea-02u-13 TaxID=2058326 RepID=UPI000C34AA93|nr:hypothetical protein [Psychromonas sp. Urea-02u-13]PKG37721.1 hypothetical protein CXF74_17455 [Psychromonas sp. Urea-02u-13]
MSLSADIREVLTHNPDLSKHDVAEILGCAPATVANYMTKVKANVEMQIPKGVINPLKMSFTPLTDVEPVHLTNDVPKTITLSAPTAMKQTTVSILDQASAMVTKLSGHVKVLEAEVEDLKIVVNDMTVNSGPLTMFVPKGGTATRARAKLEQDGLIVRVDADNYRYGFQLSKKGVDLMIGTTRNSPTSKVKGIRYNSRVLKYV